MVDEDAESEWVTATANSSSPDVSTLVTAGDGAAKPGEYAVAIRIGPTIEHVGTMRTKRLEAEVYRCLHSLDAFRHPQSWEPWCWGVTNQCQPYCDIKNIVWDAHDDFGTPQYKSGTKIRVTSWWPGWYEDRNPENLKLRDITVSFYSPSIRCVS